VGAAVPEVPAAQLEAEAPVGPARPAAERPVAGRQPVVELEAPAEPVEQAPQQAAEQQPAGPAEPELLRLAEPEHPAPPAEEAAPPQLVGRELRESERLLQRQLRWPAPYRRPQPLNQPQMGYFSSVLAQGPSGS
jgi:hypothetical protein